MNSDPTILYVDADILRYQCGSVQEKHPFVDKLIPASQEFVCRLVDGIISKALESTGAKEVRCVLSGKSNFRVDLAVTQPYKGNRDGFEKPYHFKTIEEYIVRKYPTIVVEGREADDYLGDVLRFFPNVAICGSRDKDLKTVPGWHYSWACGEKQPEKPLSWVNKYQAWHFFFYQLLIGDNTDNIIGCGFREEVPWGKDENGEPKMQLRRKGVGKVKADKILDNAKDVKELLERVTDAYEALFGDTEVDWEALMLENARLLYIGHSKDNLFNWNWVEQDIVNNEFKEEENG